MKEKSKKKLFKKEKRKNELYVCSKKDNFENLLPNKEYKYIQAKNNVKCHKKLSRKIKSSKSFINSYFIFFSLILLIVLKPDLYHSKKVELRHLSYDNYIVITVTKNWEGDQVNQILSWEASNEILPNKIKINTYGNEYETSDIQRMYTISDDSTLTLIWERQLTSCFKMFFEVPRIKTIDLSHFDLSLVTDMGSFFDNCWQLEYVNLKNGDARKVTNMDWMFSNDAELTSVDLTNFRASSITSMSGTFYNNVKLQNLDFSNFGTTSLTHMYQTFFQCKALTSLDLSSFRTPALTNMYETFMNCESLKYLDVRNFNTEKVTTMERLFQNDKQLKSLDLSNFYTPALTTMFEMFSECTNLEYLDVS